MSKLDVFGQVGSTSTVIFSDTLVKCLHIDIVDENNYSKYMARQRYVGASGSSTG